MDAPDIGLRGQNTTVGGRLYIAFELGEKSWRLSLGDGRRAQPLRGRRRRYHGSPHRDRQRPGALPSGRRHLRPQVLLSRPRRLPAPALAERIGHRQFRRGYGQYPGDPPRAPRQYGPA